MGDTAMPSTILDLNARIRAVLARVRRPAGTLLVSERRVTGPVSSGKMAERSVTVLSYDNVY
jgi:hypothetical protein